MQRGGWAGGFHPGLYHSSAQMLQQQPRQQAQQARNPLATLNGYALPKAKSKVKQQSKKQKAQSALPEPRQQAEDADEDDVGDGLEEGWFAAVSTEHLEQMGLRPHPDPIAEAASLSSVAPPEPKHKLCLPKHVLQDGISAAQFQAVNLAVSRHELTLRNGARAGFFLGDGPGVGKGRQISATLLHYFSLGKTRAIWISVSTDLVVDAHRDLNDVGALQYDAMRLHDLRQLKLRKGQKLESLPGLDQGILFCTYDLLISGSKKKPKGPEQVTRMDPEEEFGSDARLTHIVEWLGDRDCLIVLDECHKAKNCLSKEDKMASCPVGDEDQQKQAKKAAWMGKIQSDTKTARAVIELQRRCPNARLMYVSATGATEAENLGYMERLGLWGEGTAYANKKTFTGMLKDGGMAAMELVAMELKHAGAYIARTLSYEKVVFETVHEEVSPAFQSIYDTAALLWQETRTVLKAHDANKDVMRAFYAAQLRFFRQMVTAAKVDKVVELAQKALDDGHCPVIGLQSTGEARTAAFVKSHGGDDAEFDSFVEPAALVLSNFINTHMVASMTGARELLERARVLQLPKNPLDDLIERLGGPDDVAEMTGRAKRMLKGRDGKYHYVSRVTEDVGNLDMVNIHERELFQAGKKHVAVISDAASAGISIQADRKAKNQAQRVHITLELAWSADRTVQQLGRTHRSNQCHAPKYIIVSTNISGERRFASAVAARLEQLGALTQGDRRAASAADALSAFNLQNSYASKALIKLYKLLQSSGSHNPGNVMPPWLEEKVAKEFEGRAAPPEPDSFEHSMAKERVLQQWFEAATSELQAVGLLDAKRDGNVNKLLNRLLAARVELQASIFAYFGAMVDAEVKESKQAGEFENGIVKPGCTDVKLKSSTTIYLNEDSMLPTQHLTFTVDRGVAWERAQQLLEQENASNPDTIAGFYHTKNGFATLYCLAFERNARGRCERYVQGLGRRTVAKYVRLIRPDTGYGSQDMSIDVFRARYAKCTSQSTLKAAWQETFRKNTSKRHQELHLICGSVLPLIPTIGEAIEHNSRLLKHKKLQMMRVEATDTHKRYIGVHVPEVLLRYMLNAIAALQPHKPWLQLTAADEERLAAAQARTNAGATASATGAAAAAAGAAVDAAGASTSAAAAGTMAVTVAEDEDGGDSDDDGDDEECEKPAKRRQKRRRASGRPNHKRALLSAAPKVFSSGAGDTTCDKLQEAGLWAEPGEGMALKPALARAQEEAGQKVGPKRGPRAPKERFLVDDDEADDDDDDDMETGSGEESAGASDSEGSGTEAGEGSDGDEEQQRQQPRRAGARRQPQRRVPRATAGKLVSDDDGGADDGDGGSNSGDDEGGASSDMEMAAAAGKRRGKVQGGGVSAAAKHAIAAAAAKRAMAAAAKATTTAAPGSDAGGLGSRSEGCSNPEQEDDEDDAIVVLSEKPAPSFAVGKDNKKVASKQLQQVQQEEEEEEEEGFDFEPEPGVVYKVGCPCGVTHDDGEPMIECEQCFTWQHIACAGITDPKAAFICSSCMDTGAAGVADTPAPVPTAAPAALAACGAKGAAGGMLIGVMQQEQQPVQPLAAAGDDGAQPSDEELKAGLITILDEAAGSLSVKAVLAKLQQQFTACLRTRKGFLKDIIFRHTAATLAGAPATTTAAMPDAAAGGKTATPQARAVHSPAAEVTASALIAGAASPAAGASAAGAAAGRQRSLPDAAAAGCDKAYSRAAESPSAPAASGAASKRTALSAAMEDQQLPSKRRRLQHQHHQQGAEQEELDMEMVDLCDEEEEAGQQLLSDGRAQRRRAAAMLDSDDDDDVDEQQAAATKAAAAKASSSHIALPQAARTPSPAPSTKPPVSPGPAAGSTVIPAAAAATAKTSPPPAACAGQGSPNSSSRGTSSLRIVSRKSAAAAKPATAVTASAASAGASPGATAISGAAGQPSAVQVAAKPDPLSPSLQEHVIQERVAKEVAAVKQRLEQEVHADLVSKLKLARDMGIKKATTQITAEIETLKQQAAEAAGKAAEAAQQLAAAEAQRQQEAAAHAAALEAVRAEEAAKWQAQAAAVVQQQEELRAQVAAQQKQQQEQQARQEQQQVALTRQLEEQQRVQAEALAAQQEAFRLQMEEAAAAQRALMQELAELRAQREAEAAGTAAAAERGDRVASPVGATPVRSSAAAAAPDSEFVLRRLLSSGGSEEEDGPVEAAPERAGSADATGSMLVTPMAAPTTKSAVNDADAAVATGIRSAGAATAAAVLKSSCVLSAAKADAEVSPATPTAAPATPAPDAAPAKAAVAGTSMAQVTTAALLEWLQHHPKGATAPAMLAAFLASCSPGPHASADLAAVLSKQLSSCLQQLIDEVDVIRMGSSATSSCAVDMHDIATLYMGLA